MPFVSSLDCVGLDAEDGFDPEDWENRLNHNGSTSDDYRNLPKTKREEDRYSWKVFDRASELRRKAGRR